VEATEKRGKWVRTIKPVQDRFWPKVDKNGPDYNGTPCWVWTGAHSKGGYGQIRGVNGTVTLYTHRWSYEHHKGPIPDGLHLDHLCRNRSCCNPDHLDAVTNGENTRRGVGAAAQHARQTHCKNGHLFDAENTIPSGDKGRRCRTCYNEWQRETRDRRKSAGTT
jgi:hypothetical protein